jgi:nucleoside-diphosphate-sugar epimerase
MKVLLTGTDGYIGSVLAPVLIREGFDVVGLDTGYYRDGWLYSDVVSMDRAPPQRNLDLRNISSDDVAKFDAVVHLAELSNDPLGDNNPEVTFAVNHRGSVRLAELAREAGVSRFVYTSSCSVYGVGEGEILDENTPTKPQTAYAKCKVLVERDVAELATDSFSPVFLRNATAYGASPRMRFDIVLNNLAGHAWTTNRIAMTSDGTPWRPLVHIQDICRAIVCALKAPRDSIHNQIFNVGSNEDNYRVREIAEIVGAVFPGCEVSVGDNAGDNRSYRVSFDKIYTKLAGFECDWTARKGAEQLLEVFQRIDMSKETFEFRAFTRLQQLLFLQKTQQIDDKFFWTPLAGI